MDEEVKEMYKPLADSTLMGMTKKEIIEQLRIAEYNFKVTEESLNQQAENVKKLLAEERNHGHWIREGFFLKCSRCSKDVFVHRLRNIEFYKSNYCPNCGAIMDQKVDE